MSKAPEPKTTAQTNPNPVMASKSAALQPPAMKPPVAVDAPQRTSLASSMTGAPAPMSAPGSGQPGLNPRIAMDMIRRGNG